MSRRSMEITRRDFVRAGSGLAAAGLLGAARPGSLAAAEPGRSRVVLIRRQDALGEDGSPDGRVLHEMLNEAVSALLEVGEPAAAWRRLISTGDIVGIKTNVWRNLATPPALEEAIRAEVVGQGWPRATWRSTTAASVTTRFSSAPRPSSTFVRCAPTICRASAPA